MHLSTGLAGIVGVAVTFGIGLLLFVVVGRRRATSGDRDAAATARVRLRTVVAPIFSSTATA
jgi:uncharacterized protein (TIGR03382 family)